MSTTSHLIGKKVIIRTVYAGVHYGTLAEHSGDAVRLSDTRRVWYWHGAFTLSALALNGGDEQSKLSVTLPENNVLGAIEIIPVSNVAAKILDDLPAHES